VAPGLQKREALPCPLLPAFSIHPTPLPPDSPSDTIGSPSKPPGTQMVSGLEAISRAMAGRPPQPYSALANPSTSRNAICRTPSPPSLPLHSAATAWRLCPAGRQRRQGATPPRWVVGPASWCPEVHTPHALPSADLIGTNLHCGVVCCTKGPLPSLHSTPAPPTRHALTHPPTTPTPCPPHTLLLCRSRPP